MTYLVLPVKTDEVIRGLIGDLTSQKTPCFIFQVKRKIYRFYIILFNFLIFFSLFRVVVVFDKTFYPTNLYIGNSWSMLLRECIFSLLLNVFPSKEQLQNSRIKTVKFVVDVIFIIFHFPCLTIMSKMMLCKLDIFTKYQQQNSSFKKLSSL